MLIGQKTRKIAEWVFSKTGYRINRNQMLPADTPQLRAEHLENCVVFPDRNVMLNALPKGGVVAEIGVEHGHFSAKILRQTQPSKLYLVDVSEQAMRFVRQRGDLARGVASKRIELLTGLSWEVLRGFEDDTFDWIYIDGDHSYEGVRRDLVQARRTVKPGGIIVLNDYTMIYNIGVIHATNEFCLAHGWEVIYFALQYQMYCDVALRKKISAG